MRNSKRLRTKRLQWNKSFFNVALSFEFENLFFKLFWIFHPWGFHCFNSLIFKKSISFKSINYILYLVCFKFSRLHPYKIIRYVVRTCVFVSPRHNNQFSNIERIVWRKNNCFFLEVQNQTSPASNMCIVRYVFFEEYIRNF